MGIKRNEVAEPEWWSIEFAKIDKDNLFSEELWKRTIDWGTLLYHIKKTESACQLIDHYVYPSRLFTTYIDVLEANLFVLNDIFYYETGVLPKAVNNGIWISQVFHSLRFWNMDYYHEMKMLYEGLHRIENHLMVCLKHNALSEIADEVYKKSLFARGFQITDEESLSYLNKAYDYAYKAYSNTETDKNTLVGQIVNIVNTIEDYKSVLDYFIHINLSAFGIINFDYLLIMFRQSRKSELFIRPWRRDFAGSRDSLILKMEKDPELGPWVNRYTHLRKYDDEDVAVRIFCDDYYNVKDIEETFNTDNWIRLLTIAAVLQEYDEQQEHDGQKDNSAKEPYQNEALIMNLSLYFKDEETVKRFLKSIYGMKDKEVITMVNNYWKAKLCTDTSKRLWRLLHDNGLYKTGYTNWNAHLCKH